MQDRPQWQGVDSRQGSRGGASSSTASTSSAGGPAPSQKGAALGSGGRSALGDATNVVSRRQSIGSSKGAKAAASGTSGEAAAALSIYESLAENALRSVGARGVSAGGPRGAGAGGGLPAGAARAVQDAAEQLEALRVSAMQQALASRQQRLVNMASHA